MMLTIQNLSYQHPDKDLLFSGINLMVNQHDKIALIGNNGVGKSTLLKIIAKKLRPSADEQNNLHIQNIEILTNAINDYQGTLLVISHDDFFWSK